MLDKLYGLHHLRTPVSISCLWVGHQRLENWVSDTALTGIVLYMPLKHHSLNQNPVNLGMFLTVGEKLM